jgi:hypothetical protein
MPFVHRNVLWVAFDGAGLAHNQLARSKRGASERPRHTAGRNPRRSGFAAAGFAARSISCCWASKRFSSPRTGQRARKKAPSGWVFRSGPIFRSLEVWRNPFPPKGTVCESTCGYCIRCAAAA